jgi:hypothetical protein
MLVGRPETSFLLGARPRPLTPQDVSADGRVAPFAPPN